ncbi:MAG: hypothetical protein KBD73_01720 [Candidatus Magasanikbacteria bacterium]|nr:hypothetical protein [Candidatus Magasanikbacteria bacterium]
MIDKKQSSTEYINPTDGLTNRELRISNWYVLHREQFKQVGIFFLIVWSVVTIGIGVVGWGRYAFVGYFEDQKALSDSLRQVTNYKALQPQYTASNLLVSDVQIFRSGNEKYDAVTDISNPNDRWLALVEYQYIFSTGLTATGTAMVLPNSKRPVASFGIESSQFPSNTKFNILSTRWWRLNPHTLSDVSGFMNERLKFTPEKIAFHSANSTPGVPVPSISLTITNSSAYSYWQPLFYLDLMNGQSRVGLVSVNLQQFRSGETRNIDVRLFGDTPIVTDVFAYPIINIFDPTVFMKPGE